jgi:hypothetical protein
MKFFGADETTVHRRVLRDSATSVPIFPSVSRAGPHVPAHRFPGWLWTCLSSSAKVPILSDLSKRVLVAYARSKASDSAES